MSLIFFPSLCLPASVFPPCFLLFFFFHLCLSCLTLYFLSFICSYILFIRYFILGYCFPFLFFSSLWFSSLSLTVPSPCYTGKGGKEVTGRNGKFISSDIFVSSSGKSMRIPSTTEVGGRGGGLSWKCWWTNASALLAELPFRFVYWYWDRVVQEARRRLVTGNSHFCHFIEPERGGKRN